MSEGPWLEAFAPRLCADCSFLSARCVEGDGGGWSCMVAGGGNEGIDSLVGLGMLAMEGLFRLAPVVSALD